MHEFKCPWRQCFRRLFIFAPKPPHCKIASNHTITISSISTITPNQKTANVTKTYSHLFQECSIRRALDPGQQAHARMIVSGFMPTVFVTNCLLQVYVKCANFELADKVFDTMSQRDTISWNTMISGYIACGKLTEARKLFVSMPERDVVSWNSMISGYLQNGSFQKSVNVFLKMRESGFSFDHTTIAVILKACAGLEGYELGIQVHGLVIHMGLQCDVVAGSAIVDMYGKCRKLDESLRFFNEMPEKNWVSWSAMIASFVHNDELISGLKLFKEMQKKDAGFSQSTFASVFRSCAGLTAVELGSQLHGFAIKADFGSDIIVGTATLDMYAKCGNLHDARKLFNSLPNRSLQSYNAIIVGYARSSQGFEALQLFLRLQKSGLHYDEITLSGAFSACAVIKGHLEGTQVHGLAIKSCFWSNVCVANAILDMYGKCGALTEARQIFDEMERRDAVSWNAIIAAYGQNGKEEETLDLFIWMLRSRMEPDDFTYGSVLKASAGRQALNCGMQIHNIIIKSGMWMDSFVGSALVDLYCKCAKVEEAEKLHNRMEEQTTVSWNAIISGFSMQEQSEEAQKFFAWMLQTGIRPDIFTYATVLDTCANLATVGLGKQIHAQIIKQEMQSDVYISSTLVDMYSKCGNMQDSRLVFEKAAKRDFVTWNAMICGYAQHGLGGEALKTFDNMQLEDVKPNHATFVAVLRACAHMGLVGEGLRHFHSMLLDYGLHPQLEHYACMVDILGRAGRISEGLKLIEDMPFEADDVIWRTLLSICKLHGNVEVAEKAATSLLKLDPEDSSAYILLSNIYANAGIWTEVSKIRRTMRHGKLKKEPGCSWIEVMSEVHMFLVGDKSHPRCKEIYDHLNVLIDEMKWAGYVPRADYVLNDEEPEDEQQEIYPALAISGF